MCLRTIFLKRNPFKSIFRRIFTNYKWKKISDNLSAYVWNLADFYNLLFLKYLLQNLKAVFFKPQSIFKKSKKILNFQHPWTKFWTKRFFFFSTGKMANLENSLFEVEYRWLFMPFTLKERKYEFYDQWTHCL